MQQRGIIAGLFHNYNQAQKAVAQLRHAGFAQIGVAAHKPKSEARLADQLAKSGIPASPGGHGALFENAGDPEYTNPGDLRSALLDADIPQDQVNFLERHFKQEKDAVVVTVKTNPELSSEARNLLRDSGGEIEPTTVSAQAPPEPAGGPVAENELENDADEKVIELHGELLRVHKERIQRGEVRIRKEVVTEQQRLEVPVSREEIVVEHLPVAADATASQPPEASGADVRIPLTEERITAEKTPIVTDSVRVGKRSVQSAQSVSDEVKHEELKIESSGDLSDEEKKNLRDQEKHAA
ncbi:MAG TPA: YsnF/AvaK domain-containing protein [Terriglobales bacterium]|nr:YsnF/AvaK domain-containing protein [Terriglobales bacterium]